MQRQRIGGVAALACMLALGCAVSLGAVSPAYAAAGEAGAAESAVTETASAADQQQSGEVSEADSEQPTEAAGDAAENVYLLDFSAPKLGSWDVPGGQYQVKLGTTIQDALDALNLSETYQYGDVLDAADFGGDPDAHYQFLGWGAISPETGQYISLDKTLEASDFTKSGSAYVLTVEMELSDFRPYTLKNGVLTFDDDPDTEYYQLTVDMGEGITWDNILRPGAADQQQYYVFMPDIDANWSGHITQSLFVRADAQNLELGVLLNNTVGNELYIYPSDSVMLREPTEAVPYTFAVDSMTGPGKVRVTAQPEGSESTPTMPEPYDTDGNLLPYTVKDGVMTFDGRDDLGAWYQLDIVLPSAASLETIAGGAPWTMAIPARMLDADDPLYSTTGTRFFVRGNGAGESASIMVSYPADKALSCRFTQGAGSARRVTTNGVFSITVSEPSVLTFALGDETVITNSAGNSVTHTVNTITEDGVETSDDTVWSGLSLVTEWLGGAEATQAGHAMNAAVSGIKQMYVYDIHLVDPTGKEFAIPTGDQVVVTLQIPEALRGKSGLRVYHVADDGTVTDMHATVDQQAGTLTFTTSHFSTFVIAQVGQDGEGTGKPGVTKPGDFKDDATTDDTQDNADDRLTQTGDASLTIAGVAVVGAVVAFGAAALVRRKQRA